MARCRGEMRCQVVETEIWWMDNKLNSAASTRRDRTQDESIAIEGFDVAQLEGSTSQHKPRVIW